jgi:hypothetical protein
MELEDISNALSKEQIHEICSQYGCDVVWDSSQICYTVWKPDWWTGDKVATLNPHVSEEELRKIMEKL